MVGDSVYLAVEILLQAIFPLNLLGEPTINLNDKEFFIGTSACLEVCIAQVLML